MAKRPPMEMIWEKLILENSNLSNDLDKIFVKTDDGSCYQYLRRRGKDKGTTKNPRKSVVYDGVRRQVGVHRLAYIRQHGRIDAGMHVGHPELKEHDGCGHPEHLKSYVPASRQAKAKKSAQAHSPEPSSDLKKAA